MIAKDLKCFFPGGGNDERRRSDGAILSIGEVVRQFEITPRSLHFYEQRGLLTSTRRNNARYYDKSQIERLKAILKGKSLGFTLTEIENFLESGDGLLHDRKLLQSQLQYLEQRRAEIDHAITELSESLKEIA